MRSILDINSLTPDRELFERLCLAFGPSGCEDEPRRIIKEEMAGCCDRMETDRLGNTVAFIESDPQKPTLTYFAHMDEVGFLITGISPEGLLYFGNVGGIDPSVMCGRRVTVRCLDGKDRTGVLQTQPIHMLSQEQRSKMPSADDMYIDVGASSKEELEGVIAPGCYATFEGSFEYFGTDGRMVGGKAIDDRLGCAVMISLARAYYPIKDKLPVNIALAFTVREEIGVSGANTVAHRIAPDYAVILESTAAADIARVPENSRVAITGNGGAVSFMDRSTVYDREFMRYAIDLAEKKNIPVQVKKFVSGGNDAGSVHRSRGGIRTMVISAPSRYIHSAVCVIRKEDFTSIFRLACAIAENIDGLTAKTENN